MADDVKKTTAKKVPPPAKKAADEFKYTVADVADELGIQAASARIALRNAKVAKAGRSYGWNTDKDFKAIVKQLKDAKGAGDKKAA